MKNIIYLTLLLTENEISTKNKMEKGIFFFKITVEDIHLNVRTFYIFFPK